MADKYQPNTPIDQNTMSGGPFTDPYQPNIPVSRVGKILNSKTLALYNFGNVTRAQVTSTITAASWSGGVVTLTMASNSKFTANTNTGQQAVVTGMTPTAYNGTYDVTIPTSSTTQVQYNLAANPGSAVSLGTIYSTNNLADMTTLIGSPVYGIQAFTNSGVNITNWAAWESPPGIDPGQTSTAAGIQTWVQGATGRNLILTISILPTSITTTAAPGSPTWNTAALGPSGWIAQLASNAIIDDGSTTPATLQRHAQNLATNLISFGYPHAIIRIAGEMNGNSNNDCLGPTSNTNFLSVICPQWAQAWANVVIGMRKAAGAKFLFDWCPNQNFQNIAFSAYYPGDKYVDIIGMDAYDNYGGNPTTQPARWNTQPGIAAGLNAIISFAMSHNKPNSFPEWGLDFNGAFNPPTCDDPTYTAGMLGLVNATRFAYQCYFNNPNTGTPQLSTDVPGTLAAFQAACGPGGYIHSTPW